MFLNAKHTAVLCFAACMSLSTSAIADIVISGTRVIYKSDQKSVNVRLENKGNNPLLVQSWLDTGDDSAEPGSIKVPFTATPPVSRIDAKRGQTIKLMYTASSPLPKDRESVFWFNVLEVPPKPDADKVANQSLLQLAFRTRIKLFYRPAGLQGDVKTAPNELRFTRSGNQIRVDNPTVFNITFNQFFANDKEIEKAGMVPAKGSLNITLPAGAGSVSKIKYNTINDFGSSAEMMTKNVD
ncbi:fimbrial chaperone [Escherichia coli]|uniref:fimbrial chaperone n=1 Tax=Escherichia coli TaxID=562 RepID=UPI00132A68DD|nr:fimbrial chaperone [Escherichia coli]MWL34187.1 fimbrial chaperone [Escherichia coli]